VVDLHGRLDTVVCLDCSARVLRSRHQHRLEAANPEWIDLAAARAPDGDAELESDEFDRFIVPPCRRCGGTLRPDVVFFGETVPDQRVRTALQWLDGANAMLVVGSSLMVHSGFRYARLAAERGLPVAALNLGRTRADDLLSLKIEAPCSSTLKEGASRLAGIMQAAAPSHT
jgi:NAD-dependent SIR2 family protein deacetylase